MSSTILLERREATKGILASLMIVILVSACGQTQKPHANSSESVSQSGAPAKWPITAFPLSLKISATFSQNERESIKDMGDVWQAAGNNERTFFDLSGTVANRESSSVNDYYGNEMGIHAPSTWPKNLSPSSLAVTQFFGHIKFAGTVGEYIEIFHADILVNVENYSYSLDKSPGTYDLPTVILHELGHFIGMYHEQIEQSVMFPSISSGITVRDTFSKDKQNLAAKYQVNQAAFAYTAAVKSQVSTEMSNEAREPLKEGELVVGIHELRSDGSCHHLENGKEVFVH